MAHILITGAGGYIGSVLTGAALAAGHRITAIDRFFFGESALRNLSASERLRILRNDIRDLARDVKVGSRRANWRQLVPEVAIERLKPSWKLYLYPARRIERDDPVVHILHLG